MKGLRGGCKTSSLQSASPKSPQKQKHLKFWFQGPYEGYTRNHVLSDPYADVVGWGPNHGRGSDDTQQV